MNWRDENITDKQEATILKMMGILDWKIKVPKKRGEACDLIKQMMAEADKRVAVTGTMKYNPAFDTAGDDELDGDALDSDVGLFSELEDDEF
jgi:hypothetical protein